MDINVVTRFAPSPTGNLHIGGCRTALYNWLYARHNKGKMILRIEDTDKERSTDSAIKNIKDGMEWLGLNWDGDIYYQSNSIKEHQDIAYKLLESGNAYYCYCTEDELALMRESALNQKKSPIYNNKWRDRIPTDVNKKIRPVLRLKTPMIGKTIVDDSVQGLIEFDNKDIDDFVLLRSDGTPTYMLASVVDDYNQGVTHIIRGDDHLNNAARQINICLSMGWKPPKYSHIPLIHSSDGLKLSKRDGALSVSDYGDQGYLPESILNYLLRLGWSYGDKEYFTKDEMIQYFDINKVHKSAARLDLKKLLNINSYYLKEKNEDDLIKLLSKKINIKIDTVLERKMKQIIPHLKTKSKTLNELLELLEYLHIKRPLLIRENNFNIYTDEVNALIQSFKTSIERIEDWDLDSIKTLFDNFLTEYNIKLMDIAKPLRIILTGSLVPTGIYDLLIPLGKEETLNRISDYLNN
jgi:glutamyl-tRNA synthetase